MGAGQPVMGNGHNHTYFVEALQRFFKIADEKCLQVSDSEKRLNRNLLLLLSQGRLVKGVMRRQG